MQAQVWLTTSRLTLLGCALAIVACTESTTDAPAETQTLAAPLESSTSVGVRDTLDTIDLDAGRLAVGETNAGIRVFRGIPFAAPPVGDLRWRSPQPVTSWDGVRQTTDFGSACIQPPGDGRLNIAAMEGSPPLSEDCLYLNVWTPAESVTDRLPVMVYFFGGAFTEGAGSVPLYDGAALAKKGAIVVTMNYRLGAFGFFAHPTLTADSEHATSGNYGIMDMVASLGWVRDNISAFGGDPDNVTIFGQSAGAMAISSLITSPSTRGLFHRAIGQSVMGGGVLPGMRTLTAAEAAGLEAASAAGVESAAQLRALPADAVVENFRSAGMIIDNWVIPEDPALVLAEGRQNPVDVLFGANRDESFFRAQITPAQFRERAVARFGELVDDYLSLYPHADDAQAGIATAEAFRDQAFWNARRYADYQRGIGGNGYVFFFTQNPPAMPGETPLPATHASEVPYVFNNLGELPLFPDRSIPDLAEASDQDQSVADLMSSYWVNFARVGDPNASGLPEWPMHQRLDRVDAMILDADPAGETLPSVDRMLFYDRVLTRNLNAN